MKYFIIFVLFSVHYYSNLLLYCTCDFNHLLDDEDDDNNNDDDDDDDDDDNA